ncbi:MAG TPA: hypothetical protein VF247_10310, partial [Candidatus Krumholzibacteria bacterium]
RDRRVGGRQMIQDDLLKFIALIDARLEKAAIPYMLTGSVAMTFYAVPRMTRDIDVVVQCDLRSLDVLVSVFSPDCYVDRDEVLAALRTGDMFNIIHKEWLIKADLIPCKHGEFRELEFSRRRRIEMEVGSCWVVSPEDLILSKLDWSKESGSEMQQRDIAGLVRTAQKLDWKYLEKWAKALGVIDELDRARQS